MLGSQPQSPTSLIPLGLAVHTLAPTEDCASPQEHGPLLVLSLRGQLFHNPAGETLLLLWSGLHHSCSRSQEAGDGGAALPVSEALSVSVAGKGRGETTQQS